MKVVERTAADNVLNALFDQARRSSGRAALVVGAPGMGKTRLLQEVRRRAGEAGALALSAVASRAERAVPMGVVRQLFGTAHRVLGEQRAARLAELIDAAEGFRLSGPWPDRVVVPRGAAEEAHGLIVGLAERAPLVLIVDDVHDADPASLQCLLYLVRRVAPCRMLLVLGGRTGGRHAMSELSAEFVRNPACTLIRLSPLTGTDPILTAELGAATSRAAGDAWLRESGGSPLLLHALAADRRDPGQELPRPGETFQLAVKYLLDQLTEPELGTAQALAVLGSEATPGRLDRLTTRPHGSGSVTCTALEGLGLVTRYRYNSTAAAAAVLERMPPGKRAAAHRRAARVLHDDGACASSVARHLLAGGRDDGLWGQDVLRRAAEQALRDGDPRWAVSCLRAADAYTGAPDQADVRAELLSAEWELNPAVAHRYLDPLLDQHRRGRLTPRNSIRLVAYLMWHGRPTEAAEILTDLDRRAEEIPVGLRMRLESTRAWFGHVYPLGGIPPQERPTPGVAERLLTATLHDPALAPSISAMAFVLHRRPYGVTEAYEGQLLRMARRSRTARAVLAAAGAALEAQHGNHALARSRADQALSLISPDAWGITVGIPLAAALIGCTGVGDWAGAAECARVPVPEMMFSTLPGAHYLYARGAYHLAEGRHHAALGDLFACRDLLSHWPLDLSGLIPWRAAAAEASRGLGRGQGLGEPPGMKNPARRTAGTITQAERRVAQLAVEGSTNREIATRLYLTTSTVEQHLTRIYRKLGIKGRADLSVALATEE
ncbi:AAA family ATPase [Streptomyces sp. NPDC018610]|uniref:AAA family ATPase n=1 Tax=Streptomyces sp. NPDC018610 TaxID=3365049 RepID=UPI0037BDBF19